MTNVELKHALEGLGWTQRHLAKRLDVDEATVSRWISGKQSSPAYLKEYLRVMLLIKEAADG